MGTHHFNSRPHGGRLPSPRKENFTNEISTHALTEGDHQPAATGSPVSYFNSRPHGGRLHWLFFFAHQAIFQLTPSRRATSARVSTDAVEVAFQLTPSRRATHLFGQLSFHILISTHALTEGDYASPAVKESYIKFQLTPSRRATIADDQVRVVLLFQLTPSRRATHENHLPLRMVIFQLTPSRRATILSRIVERKWKDFNSRPHGGRRLSRNSPIVLVYFNSRPHGGRLQPVADQIHLKNFNSRPHGGRREKSVNFPVWLISTHALTEGDRNRFGRKFRKRIFQLTPSRRATKSGSVLVLQWEFQLTPSRRATSGFFSVALIVFNFNSRPHGGRRGRSEMPYDNAAFQLTPSRRATQPLNERSL